jgi:molecular chaperone GrpE
MMRSTLFILTAFSASDAFVTGPCYQHRSHHTTALRMAEASDNSSNTDILNSPAFLRRKVDVLKSDIAEMQEKLNAAENMLEENQAEWKPQIDALQNEYKAMQQRNTKKRDSADEQATSQVARQLLEVLDNFDRAFGVVIPETEEQAVIAQAYESVYHDILNQFHKLGIEEVKTVGTEFDYQIHQAVMQRPSDQFEEGIVCEEYQKGFKIGDTLIRAAMVAVAA